MVIAMTKERLRRYRAIVREQEQIEQKLSAIEAALYHPKIQHMSGMPSAPSPGNSSEDLAIKHLELQDLYREKQAELAREQLAIEQAIDTLEPTERMLMRYRYIDGLKWEEICVKMNYGWSQIHVIHAHALRELEGKDAD